MLRRSMMVRCLILFLGMALMPLQVAAIGASPVISHVQTGAVGAATQELVLLYNNSEEVINLTGWCIKYASASDITQSEIFCIEPPNENTKLMLGGYSHAIIASSEYIAAHPEFISDGTFSAGMSGTSGHLRLFDSQKTEIDRIGWGAAVHPESTAAAAHETGKLLTRKTTSETKLLQDTNANSADFIQAATSQLPQSGVYEEIVEVDVCANLDGLQLHVPEGHETVEGENCSPVASESAVIQITEILPNVSGTDTGKEFIELFNPGDHSVQLKGYRLSLGPDNDKAYTFLEQLLTPKTYVSFSDLLTGIVLPNSSASLQLVAPAGNTISVTESYDSPKDDQAWALINDMWQFTNRPTPAAANLASLQTTEQTEESLAACPEGKVRNAETNRCKNIDDDSELKPCAEGQVRNPETGRCRMTTGTQSNLVPCREGQERNSETNRCRNIISTASALKECETGEERNSETNRCRKVAGASTANLSPVNDVPAASKPSFQKIWAIAALAVAAVGYGLFEWRTEAANFIRKLTKTKS